MHALLVRLPSVYTVYDLLEYLVKDTFKARLAVTTAAELEVYQDATCQKTWRMSTTLLDVYNEVKSWMDDENALCIVRPTPVQHPTPTYAPTSTGGLHPWVNFSSLEVLVIELKILTETQIALWLVTGSVTDALSTKGVRSRLYRLADDQLAYYDPCQSKAFCYEDQTLIVYMLFELRAKHFSLKAGF
ncbi:hypothetical protein SeLEV6574_g01934 [Synchytrium endobioticum]|uniref:Uncharacterized protein n=1 Tax=Synchytrium endobioticum TaxID=286115 RepID=A0A507CVS1_9FUNG|nr:hypothetical protein SeLEV6574_g05164 [Synchytrium endobioticum]TPX48635.1 hypothetical protein SeLEV6574_g01934 [Synchytrium endobioticum]